MWGGVQSECFYGLDEERTVIVILHGYNVLLQVCSK